MLTEHHTPIRVLEDGETWTPEEVSTLFLTQEQFRLLCEESSLYSVVSEFDVPMTNLELAFANLIVDILSNPDSLQLADSLSISKFELDELYERAMFLVN